jgi:hypothetical protein
MRSDARVNEYPNLLVGSTGDKYTPREVRLKVSQFSELGIRTVEHKTMYFHNSGRRHIFQPAIWRVVRVVIIVMVRKIMKRYNFLEEQTIYHCPKINKSTMFCTTQIVGCCRYFPYWRVVLLYFLWLLKLHIENIGATAQKIPAVNSAAFFGWRIDKG